MFETLTEKLQIAFKNLRGKTKLSEDDVETALGEIRRALLEADVNYKVVRDFVATIKERATGAEVMEGLNPAQQVVKIVDEELTVLLGGTSDDNSLHFAPVNQGPTVIMMVGLQGSGKTTHCGKLAQYLTKAGKKPLLVACDIYRPAAIRQLEVVGGQVHTPVFTLGDQVDPAQIAQKAVAQAKQNGNDVVIIDTAGRLQIDEPLMKELSRVKKAVQPTEVLLVLDSMTGQEAVNVAKGFHDELDVTGFILTKLDSDARGGAALSLRSVAQAPIKFMGVGEKMDALEVFHADRMAQRILGMGDVLSLIERAEAALDAQQTADLEKKFRQNSFDFDDFMNAMRQMKQLGSMKQILSMLPGMGAQLKDVDIDDSQLARVEAMILSMTKGERRNPDILNGSRRRRVAIGSGHTIQDVNSLINRFAEMRKMMSSMSKMGAAQGKGKPGFPGLGAPPAGMGMGGGFGSGFGGGRPIMPGMPGKHAAGSANKKNKKQKNRGGYPFGR